VIVVIADDLSGAAELANVAVETGLSADVQMRFDGRAGADVVCVDTETRSLAPARAVEIVSAVAAAVARTGVSHCFKKCDSVLRGHVAEEARAIARALGKSRVLLVPANPSRRRIIRNGEYFVDGVPLSESPVGRETEHRRWSSHVETLLGDARGIEHPDIVSYDDVVRHARSVDAHTLPVGAADFFRAFLQNAHDVAAVPHAYPHHARVADGLSLFVCGSHTAWVMGRRDELAAAGIAVCTMPSALMAPSAEQTALREWAHSAVGAVGERGAVALAIGDAHAARNIAPPSLVQRLADAVALVLAQGTFGYVYVEGGDTAAAVVATLQLEHFRAELSPGPGVGALRPVGGSAPLFLIKPGSYPWPAGVMSR
jgi:uncharacterized protein YgbK (DUF1537 family)